MTSGTNCVSIRPRLHSVNIITDIIRLISAICRQAVWMYQYSSRLFQSNRGLLQVYLTALFVRFWLRQTTVHVQPDYSSCSATLQFMFSQTTFMFSQTTVYVQTDYQYSSGCHYMQYSLQQSLYFETTNGNLKMQSYFPGNLKIKFQHPKLQF